MAISHSGKPIRSSTLTKFRWMLKHPGERALGHSHADGGRRGYGPTPVKTLEKHFLGTPGLRVLAPTSFGDPGQLLIDTI